MKSVITPAWDNHRCNVVTHRDNCSGGGPGTVVTVVCPSTAPMETDKEVPAQIHTHATRPDNNTAHAYTECSLLVVLIYCGKFLMLFIQMPCDH